MKKFYFFNWILLLVGLVSSSVFGQTTVNYTFANTSGDVDENVSFTTEKNNATAIPAFTSGALRLYTGSTNGNSITLHTTNNVKITSVIFKGVSGNVGNAKYFVDGGTTSTNISAVNNNYTIQNLNAITSLQFQNAITGSSGHIRLTGLTLTYETVANTPPVVSSKTITGTYGVLLTDGTITATNNPTSWTQTGVLPTGISFDKGVFSGTPTQTGTFVTQITATNATGISTPADVTFNISKANQIVNELVDMTKSITIKTFELPTNTNANLALSYVSSNTDVATISGSTITINKIGETTISATNIGDSNWNSFSKDVKLIVTEDNSNGNHLVISQVYGGGGNSGATYKNDFVELYNPTSSSVNLSGLYVQYSSASGTFGNSGFVALPDFNIQPNQYYLIQLAGGSNGKDLPISDLLSVDVNLSATNGKVALSNGISTSNNSTQFVDLVGFGTANAHEGTKAAPAGSNTLSIIRKENGKIDTNSNFDDFETGTPNPRNSSFGMMGTSTTWQNGTWSNGEADLTKDVIVKGNLEVNTAISAKTLTVSDAGGTVSVKSGGSLTVDGKIDNQAGLTGLVVENGGNLIQNQNVVNSGAITVNRNSQSMVRNDMTFWSSPVQQEAWQQTIRSFSPETLYNRFWTYNEATNEFSQILTSDTDSKLFEAGKGVSIRVKNTLATGTNAIHNGVFTGVPFNGDITVPVQFTAGGYNLVGNPYASNINVEKFLAANTSVNSLYFWTHQFAVGSTEYANNYAAFSVAGSVIPGLTNISLGQGFIVGLSQATPTVSFNNAMRTAQDAKFYKNSTIEKNRIWLSLSKEDKPVSQILLAYMDGATNGIDNQIDAKVMQRGSSAIYTLINDEAYAIQGRSLPFKTDDVVKLGFEALEQGNYTINIEQVDGLFNENQTVYLKDKELNQVYNLSESAYKFASKAGEFNNRFELVYADKTLATDDLTKNNIVVYNTNNTIVVDSKQSKIVSVELYDIQGRRVVEKNKINSNSFQIQSSAKGVLVIKVLTEDGKVKTQKIVNK